MAVHHIRRKLQTYDALSGVNHAFAAASRNVWQLERAGLLPIFKMRVFQGLIRELQSIISHDVVDRMHAVEDEDSFRYGKTRIAWEHHLDPERPAFRQNP